jgi:hypothetical protein
VTSTGNAGHFKKNITMVFQMLLCGECYEKVYTEDVQTIHRSGLKLEKISAGEDQQQLKTVDFDF